MINVINMSRCPEIHKFEFSGQKQGRVTVKDTHRSWTDEAYTHTHLVHTVAGEG